MPDTEITVHGDMNTVSGAQFTDAPPVPEIYANHVVPAVTSFEVTLHFGSILEISQGIAKVARRVSVVLTPEVAKILNFQLATGLAQYEKSVRPIPMNMKIAPPPTSPPDLQG